MDVAINVAVVVLRGCHDATAPGRPTVTRWLQGGYKVVTARLDGRRQGVVRGCKVGEARVARAFGGLDDVVDHVAKDLVVMRWFQGGYQVVIRFQGGYKAVTRWL